MLNTRLKLILLIILGLSFSANAKEDDKQAVDRAQAIERAKKDTNGRVLKVNQDKDKYRVKVLQKSGRVVQVDVDKKSGKVTQPKQKDKK
ncbi:PepSY domain-containing protein [Alteromonadaceae bacterium BrNp21-10]|nr:PepSY domain-containing protein [Alteromonadaceae bacterium BrNp21-10]